MKAQTLLMLTALFILPSCNDDEEALSSYRTCPDDHHPHLIDLGLPSGTKWACCNMGASTPESYGSYYAWGETEEKTEFTAGNYSYCSAEDTNGDGKCDRYDNVSEFQQLGENIAGTNYDVAHIKWGASWTLPSIEQIEELVMNCSREWITQNGVSGYRFQGPNQSTIFLPAASYYVDDLEPHQGFSGYYWSSNPYTERDAHYLNFNSQGCDWRHYHYSYRYFGYTVRPVSR